MIATTKRNPGKIKATEVTAFQRKYDLQVDKDLGKPPIFGNQCMGQVEEIEKAVGQKAAGKMELVPVLVLLGIGVFIGLFLTAVLGM